MAIIEIYGDLLREGNPALPIGHCISACGAMRKGFAHQLCDWFPENRMQYIRTPVGKTNRVVTVNGTVLYNIVTKVKAHNKPMIKNLASALFDLKMQMIFHGEMAINCPKIGCGRDLLLWGDVKNLIETIFWDTNIVFYVYFID